MLNMDTCGGNTESYKEAIRKIDKETDLLFSLCKERKTIESKKVIDIIMTITDIIQGLDKEEKKLWV